MDAPKPRPLLEWAVSSSPLPGQRVCGDGHVVQDFPGGVLLGAIDGLGHGPDAAEAAQLAARVLAEHAGESVPTLLQCCHKALRVTRGAAISLGCITEGQLVWAGVGDVEAVLVRAGGGSEKAAREWVVRRGGVVGLNLPRLDPATLALRPEDVLLFATDGLREGFADRFDSRGPVKTLADRLLLRFRKGTDDALVLVARYLGAASRISAR